MEDDKKQLAEDEQIQKEVDAYFKENHSDGESNSHGNIYANIPIEDTSSIDKTNAPASLIGGSALAGAGAAHTNAIRRIGGNLLKAGEGVYQNPSGSTKIPSTSIPESHVSVEFHPERYDTEVDEIMQSIRDKENPTGRQKERGHNWETNRESLATKSNLANVPDASKAIVEAGPMTPTRAGVAVPEHVARGLEEERLLKLAQEQWAKKQAEAQIDAQKEAQKIAQQKAEAELASKNAKIGTAKGIGKVIVGGAGGALAGMDFYDMYQEMKKNGWSDEAIGKALSGTGGLAMMIPTPATEIGGLALQGAGMAYPYVAPVVRKAFK
jgi:hypothetical protein